MRMHSGHSFHPVNDILPHHGEDMINDIREESEDDSGMWLPHPTNFLTMNTGFQMFEWTLENMIVSHQQYLEVIRNCTRSLFPKTKHSINADEDVASLPEHDQIVIPSASGSLANRTRKSSCTTANWKL
jgi:hypothetical protein